MYNYYVQSISNVYFDEIVIDMSLGMNILLYVFKLIKYCYMSVIFNNIIEFVKLIELDIHLFVIDFLMIAMIRTNHHSEDEKLITISTWNVI